MFPSRYFPSSYFAPRYWPGIAIDDGGGSTVALGDILLTSVLAIKLLRTAAPIASLRTVSAFAPANTVKGVI